MEKNIFIHDHPLIQHKISLLRDKNTSTNAFRHLVEEIAMLMGFEALRDLPLCDVEVETPIETCMTPMLAGKKLVIVPILRAGLGMVNGLTALVPSARIGHIGLYRDEETHEPHEYYCKLPHPIEDRTIVVLDPMLATGGSAVAAVDFIKQRGGTQHQVYVHHCRSRGRPPFDRSPSRCPALHRPFGPLSQRGRLHLSWTGRCGRPNFWNKINTLYDRRRIDDYASIFR